MKEEIAEEVWREIKNETARKKVTIRIPEKWVKDIKNDLKKTKNGKKESMNNYVLRLIKKELYP